MISKAEIIRLLCLKKNQICFVSEGKYHLIPLDQTETFDNPEDVIAALEKK